MSIKKQDGYIVTGAAGFIGSNLIKALLVTGEAAGDYRVVGKDHMFGGSYENLKGLSFPLVPQGIRDPGDLQAELAVIAPKAVFHLAMLDGDADPSYFSTAIEENYICWLAALKAAVDAVTPFVFCSTQEVFCDKDPVPLTEPNKGFCTELGFELLNLERMQQELRDHQPGANYEHAYIMGLRLPEVYGPGESHKKIPSIVYRLVKYMMNSTTIKVPEDPDYWKLDLMHVNDVCKAMICAADYANDSSASRENSNFIFNVGSGDVIPIKALVYMIKRILEERNVTCAEIGLVKADELTSEDLCYRGTRPRDQRIDLKPVKNAIGFVPGIMSEYGVTTYIEHLLKI